MKLLIIIIIILITVLAGLNVTGHGLVVDDDQNSEYSLTVNDKHEYVSVNGGPVNDLKEFRDNQVSMVTDVFGLFINEVLSP